MKIFLSSSFSWFLSSFSQFSFFLLPIFSFYFLTLFFYFSISWLFSVIHFVCFLQWMNECNMLYHPQSFVSWMICIRFFFFFSLSCLDFPFLLISISFLTFFLLISLSFLIFFSIAEVNDPKMMMIVSLSNGWLTISSLSFFKTSEITHQIVGLIRLISHQLLIRFLLNERHKSQRKNCLCFWIKSNEEVKWNAVKSNDN